MRILRVIECWIFESAIWKFIACILAISLFKTGIWYIPTLEAYMEIAKDPFTNPLRDPLSHYIFWSWLGPFFAWLIGATQFRAFFSLHLVFSLVFTLVFIKTIFKQLPHSHARAALILFSILPASTTAYFWVSYDSLTLLLMMLALAYPRHMALTFAMGILLGMQHFEQGLIASAALLFAVAWARRMALRLGYSTWFCIVWLLGIFAGKLILVAIFKYHAIEINSGRPYTLLHQLAGIASMFAFRFQYIIWSVLGLGWLVALRYLDWGKRAIPFFTALLGLCLLLPFVSDQTRVLAIVTFPLLFVFWISNEDFWSKITRQEISLAFVLWLIIPWSWAEAGMPSWSIFLHDLVYVMHVLFGWFTIPANITMWPFS